MLLFNVGNFSSVEEFFVQGGQWVLVHGGQGVLVRMGPVYFGVRGSGGFKPTFKAIEMIEFPIPCKFLVGNNG